jgi:AAA family ATP:ADP antiporter
MTEAAHPETKKFGPVREFFWPIYQNELKKFIPLALMQFFVIFVYTILRNTKDALVVDAGGAAVIPFLKGYVVFPASILFVIAYTRLVDMMSKEKVFHTVTSFFLLFFAVFGFLIYPNRELLHPAQDTILGLKTSYPSFEHFISIFETWSFSSFYVMAELWGSVMNALLFWQFANEITRTEEAKRFYAMFILLSNFSTIFAGASVKIFSQTESATTSIYLITATTALSALVIMSIYKWVGDHVLTDPRLYSKASQAGKPKKKKVKLSFGESFKVLLTSKYLFMIMLLVLCYGISINLIELLWKNQMKAAFSNMQDYNNFMGNLSIGTGISTILIVLASKGVIARFGWFWGAIATPLTIMVTGIIFFGCLFFSHLIEPLAAMLGLSTLMLSVWIGTFQNFFSKSIKYGLFDPTKNMAYIPLEDDLKAKGQASVEVIGGRLGKASGGYIASGLLMAAPFLGLDNTVTGISPILSIFMMAVLCLWIYGVSVLNGLYTKKLEEVEGAASKESAEKALA